MTQHNHLPSVRDLARMIDHSLLHPMLTDAQLHEGLALARRGADGPSAQSGRGAL